LKPCATRGEDAAGNSGLHINKRLLAMHLPCVYVRTLLAISANELQRFAQQSDRSDHFDTAVTTSMHELCTLVVQERQNVMTLLRRFTLLLILLGASLIVPEAATANTLVLTDYNLGNSNFVNNAAGGGGPFEAKTTGAALGVADFITFCIEYNEHFSYGGTYNFELSDSAKNGGVAGGNPDPVSDATKWLYYEVVSGGYTSMYSAATGFGLSNDVGATFQNAIWYLEEERTAADIGGTSGAGYLLASYALANQNWNALYALGNRVYAMNLTDAAGGRNQDQLAYTFELRTQEIPVPEPASLTLLGAGLFVVARRLRKKDVMKRSV
jgi:hypothetical protein